MHIPRGVNNTIVVESLRRHGQITEWEARHSCESDSYSYIKILTLGEISNGIPIFCPHCQNQIIIFERMIVIDEAGPRDDWFGRYNERVEKHFDRYHQRMKKERMKVGL